MSRVLFFAVFALPLALLLVSPVAAQEPASGPTLEQIMADPIWIGKTPQNPYFSADSRFVYFERAREGEDDTDLVRLPRDGGEADVIEGAEWAATDAPRGAWSNDRRHYAFVRLGDVFVRDLESGELHQLTRTAAAEFAPTFLLDGRVAFQRDGQVYAAGVPGDEASRGVVEQVSDVRAEKDPGEEEEAEDYLSRQQPRLLDWVRERDERRELSETRDRERRAADPTAPPRPFYLGEDIEIEGQAVSPAGDALLVLAAPAKRDEGRKDQMPSYVSADGYVEIREVRAKVGTAEAWAHRLHLLDLASHESFEIDLSGLPGVTDDPLAEIRAAHEDQENGEEDSESEGSENDSEGDESTQNEGSEDESNEPRAVRLEEAPVWSPDGRRVALHLHSYDNKDRWTVSIDTADLPEPGTDGHDATIEPTLVHRLSDWDGWINWSFNEFGWLDERTLFFLSEATGYSQLYVHDVESGETRRLGATGENSLADAVVSDPAPTADGRFVYVQANPEQPGRYDVFRIATGLSRSDTGEPVEGQVERITTLGGRTPFVLSPDGEWLVVEGSSVGRPPDLFVQPARPGETAEQLTDTVSEAFLAVDWVEPEIVPVPSSHIDRPIWSRFYPARHPDRLRDAEGRVPAVVFVHGAGYLQNAHSGWSTYFREFMFHTLLAEAGYHVLDMDYRGSAGYGAEWRTAIYRHMGEPELRDLLDGVDWLVAEHGVDAERVGVYGGSYGGFMAFMALFKEPGAFAAGAALRPVTDWAHYNHPYTSNILNTPEVDPVAYERSSPIEFAEGLADPLLICAPMLDDNVFFQDTVRLVQKLIELEKTDWEVAIYPVEPHGFRTPSSWLDEYRRIYRLFQEHLAP